MWCARPTTEYFFVGLAILPKPSVSACRSKRILGRTTIRSMLRYSPDRGPPAKCPPPQSADPPPHEDVVISVLSAQSQNQNAADHISATFEDTETSNTSPYEIVECCFSLRAWSSSTSCPPPSHKISALYFDRSSSPSMIPCT